MGEQQQWCDHARSREVPRRQHGLSAQLRPAAGRYAGLLGRQQFRAAERPRGGVRGDHERPQPIVRVACERDGCLLAGHGSDWNIQLHRARAESSLWSTPRRKHELLVGNQRLGRDLQASHGGLEQRVRDSHGRQRQLRERARSRRHLRQGERRWLAVRHRNGRRHLQLGPSGPVRRWLRRSGARRLRRLLPHHFRDHHLHERFSADAGRALQSDRRGRESVLRSPFR